MKTSLLLNCLKGLFDILHFGGALQLQHVEHKDDLSFEQILVVILLLFQLLVFHLVNDLVFLLGSNDVSAGNQLFLLLILLLLIFRLILFGSEQLLDSVEFLHQLVVLFLKLLDFLAGVLLHSLFVLLLLLSFSDIVQVLFLQLFFEFELRDLELDLVVFLVLLIEVLFDFLNDLLQLVDFVLDFFLLTLELLNQGVVLEFLLDSQLDLFVLSSEFFGLVSQLVDSVLVLAHFLDQSLSHVVGLILLNFELVGFVQVQKGEVDLGDLLLESLVVSVALPGVSVGLLLGLVLLQLLFVEQGELVLLPSLLFVKLAVDVLDLVAKLFYLLFQKVLFVVELFVERDQLFLLLVVVFDLVDDVLELLVGKHVVLDLVLKSLVEFLLLVDDLLVRLDVLLQLLFVGLLNLPFLLGKSGDLVRGVELFLDLFLPVLGPLLLLSLVLLDFSDSLLFLLGMMGNGLDFHFWVFGAHL